MPRLEGSVAIVTGASRGGGRGIALALGAEGATVYVTGRSVRGGSMRPDLPGTTIDDTAEQVTARGGAGIPVRCDHTVEAEIEALFEHVQQEHGRLDILVNNAWGGYEEHDGAFKGPFWEWSISRWDKMLKTGVWSDMVTSYYAVPLMLPHRQGLIVNITLAVGEYDGGWLFYHTAKTAINHLTFGMAQDLRPYGVAVVGLSPGWMCTEAVMSDKPPHKRPTGQALDESESVEYGGRAVVALATDPGVLEKSGRILHTRDLGREYGFVDIDGKEPLLYEGCEGWTRR
ncbi:MAG: SDR family NAD(P)-dependent oxidoreductase [Anaerolineae bacterium]|nr:SDR family NAD(P)-dependent oxidoreductase [Anaerolineae bacterium]